jgi:hypothetical protein
MTVTEFGWLIEFVGDVGFGPTYYGHEISCDDEETCFTRDPLKAIRFCRKEDADRAAKTFGWTEYRATHHAWG